MDKKLHPIALIHAFTVNTINLMPHYITLVKGRSFYCNNGIIMAYVYQTVAFKSFTMYRMQMFDAEFNYSHAVPRGESFLQIIDCPFLPVCDATHLMAGRYWWMDSKHAGHRNWWRKVTQRFWDTRLKARDQLMSQFANNWRLLCCQWTGTYCYVSSMKIISIRQCQQPSRE